MQSVGEGLTGYSKSNDGFLGKAAGVAGGVYSDVGCAFQRHENPDPNAKPCPSANAASSPQR